MVETLNLFRNIYQQWKGRKKRTSRQELAAAFRFRYSCFKDLLDSNTQLLNIIADLEEKLQGRQVFGMSYVRSQSARAAFHAFRMIKSLDVLSGHKYPFLYDVLDRINARLKAKLGERKEAAAIEWILPYSRVTNEMVDWVGGKNASLGEVLNRVKLPIPAGFAISTHACDSFLAHNDLVDEINKKKMELDPQDPRTLQGVSQEVQKLIAVAMLPPALAEAILAAYACLAESLCPSGAEEFSLRVSMRSSAIGEDSELSFAGQYLTVLNVTGDRLIQAYKDIVASLYSPRAISYRLNKGIRDEDGAMGVACLEMVDSVASGVMYSHHPFQVTEDRIIITAVWGLGPYAVEGVITPDTYEVAKDRELRLLEARVSPKPMRLVSRPDGSLGEEPVAPELQDKPCLTPEQVKTLASYAVKLEDHYRCPQDIEWALDRDGRLLVLQARPLHLQVPADGDRQAIPTVRGYPLLLEGGAVAYPGVGSGPAYPVGSDEDLFNFPEGAVLVARHSSPKFVLAMPKAQAIVTDAGSISGHMASLAREFAVPTLLDAKVATSAIPAGLEVTVDAYTGRVYLGKVPELLARQRDREPHMKGTQVYRILKEVAAQIVPLSLLDPKSPDFTAAACQSLHDIGRLVHELSYTEMFQISDLVSEREGGARKLEASIPLDLYLIDLGGGVAEGARDKRRATAAEITSVPLEALLRGMTHEGLQTREPRPIQFSGFFSVMREQMLAQPNLEERFGDRSYAIISDKYLNFSSRVGYHYSVLDSYCGQTVNKNYITFSFKGGAADDVRRNRRVRAIARILTTLDFAVEVKGDRVDARLQKYDCAKIIEKLDQLGRLLSFTRQMDMLMTSEAAVESVAKNFLKGNYRLELQETSDAARHPINE